MVAYQMPTNVSDRELYCGVSNSLDNAKAWCHLVNSLEGLERVSEVSPEGYQKVQMDASLPWERSVRVKKNTFAELDFCNMFQESNCSFRKAAFSPLYI